MKFLLLGYGLFLAPELDGFALPAAWRKATRNMIMATASLERALPAGFLAAHADETGFVLGSNSGELDTSSEFLMTLARSKMARPLLFQNSLHNATTGFASIHYKLTGPSFTISSGAATPGEALSLARSLMLDGACGACLVTLVEGHKMMAKMIGEDLREGSVSLLLAREDFAPGFAGQPFDFAAWSTPYEKQNSPLFNIDGSDFFRRAQALP